MFSVTPSKGSRKVFRNYDKNIYKLRHLIENAFYISKKWREIAPQYAKNVASFVASVQIRCIAIWLKFIDDMLESIQLFIYSFHRFLCNSLKTHRFKSLQ